MNHEAVYRTAPATQGQYKISMKQTIEVEKSWLTLKVEKGLLNSTKFVNLI